MNYPYVIRILLALALVITPVSVRAGPTSEVTLAENQRVTIVNLQSDALGASAAQRLSDYLEACLGTRPVILAAIPADAMQSTIVLGDARIASSYRMSAPAKASEESFSLRTAHETGPLAVISGTTSRGIRRGVDRLIFLTRQPAKGGLRVPATAITESPWKESRSYMLVNWSPDDVRTKFSNRMVNKQVDVVYRYSDEQLRRYVQMFDELGFSGVQVGESSVSWAMSGSMEAYQDRIRKIALAAKSLGQQVAYIIWAAEFNVGWSDREMVYQPRDGYTQFTDPAVRAYFEKYYEHYTLMAPHVDLVVGHWFDSGRLESMSDVISYQKRLKEMMLARNPHLRFAVNTWGHPDFFDALLKARMTDFVLLEMSMPFAMSQETRQQFRRRAKANGFQLGLWGWYMTELETDQLPNMHVNGHVMKEYITSMRNGPEKILPVSYWSEMEAYHLANIYTMYQTAQLLWNPDRDPDVLLQEITDAIWGPKDGSIILDALKLIEDTRSGRSWNTFSYLSPGRQDGTPDPTSDAQRARQALTALAQLEPDSHYVPKVTLPVSRAVLRDLMIPHLEQIRQFAEFRLAFARLEKNAQDGAGVAALRTTLAQIWQPIPEFDTWIGTHGQGESRAQDRLIAAFCSKYGIEPPVPRWKLTRDANRVFEKLQSEQRAFPKAHIVGAHEAAAEFSFEWDKNNDYSYARKLLKKLEDDGLVQSLGGDRYQLTRWEDMNLLLRLH